MYIASFTKVESKHVQDKWETHDLSIKESLYSILFSGFYDDFWVHSIHYSIYTIHINKNTLKIYTIHAKHLYYTYNIYINLSPLK